MKEKHNKQAYLHPTIQITYVAVEDGFRLSNSASNGFEDASAEPITGSTHLIF